MVGLGAGIYHSLVTVQDRDLNAVHDPMDSGSTYTDRMTVRCNVSELPKREQRAEDFGQTYTADYGFKFVFRGVHNFPVGSCLFKIVADGRIFQPVGATHQTGIGRGQTCSWCYADLIQPIR